jgi:predicted transcriptional regulator of viral defense system
MPCIVFSDNSIFWYFHKVSYLMPAGLTQLETRFFGYTQSRAKGIVRSGELVDRLELTVPQERKLLSRLSRRNLIARVRRGLYLVPRQIPPGGSWSPSEALALNTLFDDLRGRYQISGTNAFSRYGWDEQIPNRTFVYNNCISGRRVIGAVQLTLVKVEKDRLGATDVITTPEGLNLVYASKARALIDAIYDWSRFETLPRAYDWIRTELKKDAQLAAELVSVALRYGNQATLRRLGQLLEDADVPESLLRKIDKELRPTSSMIPWVPTFPKRGSASNRWKVVVNV